MFVFLKLLFVLLLEDVLVRKKNHHLWPLILIPVYHSNTMNLMSNVILHSIHYFLVMYVGFKFELLAKIQLKLFQLIEKIQVTEI